MSERLYRFRIQTPGSTSLSTSALDVTLDGSRLREPFTIRHPIVIPQHGRTESQPWEVHITDVNSSFTAQLADSSGRMDLLGRLAYGQTNTDGGGWVTKGAGRITDVYLDEAIASYRVVVEDERAMEGTALLFNSTNTTRLFPGCPASNYGWFAARKGYVEMLRASTAGSTNFWRVVFHPDWYPMAEGAKDAIRSDLIANPLIASGSGNFTHTRLRIGSSDFELVSTSDVASTNVNGWQKPSPNYLDGIDAWFTDGNPLKFWITATSARLGTGSAGVITFSSAYLHMMSAPPSKATPLHIGGEAGVHPMQVLKDCYDLDYSADGTPGIRYSTAAFSTGSTGLLGQPMPKVRFRITEPQSMRQWLEDKIYKPFMLVPTIDASGQIVPRSMKLPHSSADVTSEFTAATLRDPHPTWGHPRRDAITVLNVEYEHERYDFASESADFIGTEIRSYELDHDRMAKIGRKVHTLEAHGYKTGPTGQMHVDADRYAAYIERDYFDRFGDGPIMGSMYALSTMDSVIPGQFVKVTLGTYPNPGTLARTGTRIVQVLGKNDTPWGPEFQYLDAGPNAQVLASPTIALSTVAGDPKHSINAAVGTVPTGGGFNLEFAQSATTAAPAVNSQLWQSVETTARTAATYRIGRIPSNTKIWGRVQATHPNKFRSPWVNSTVGKTTAKITGPTVFTSAAKTAKTVLGTWTVGDKGYKTAVHLDTSTSASLSTANEVTVIPPGSNRYSWTGLTAGTKYLFGVRHKDDYGGYSTGITRAITTSTAAASVAPSLSGIGLLMGGAA